MGECPICAAEVPFDGAIQGELRECPECAQELEVTSVDPFELDEAPEQDEDWGE